MKKRLVLGGAAIASAMVLGLLAACGGNGNGPAAAGASSPGSGGQAALQAYVGCLRQHGVTITIPSGRPSGRPSERPSGVRPSGGRGGGFGGGFGGLFGTQAPSGVDQSTWEAAQQACASVRPSFGARAGGGGSAFQAYRNCLMEHGVTPSGGPNSFDTADPKVAAAMAACAPLRPSGRPGGAPSPS